MPYVGHDIGAVLEVIRSTAAQLEAMNLPPPGAWDAAQCDAAYRRGYDAFDRGDYLQAVECFAPLLSACPHVAGYAEALALCAQHLGELEAALPLFMAAALIDQTSPEPMYRVGRCLYSLASFDAACQAMHETVLRCGTQGKYADVKSAARHLMEKARHSV
ncbi:hypothetical protein [Pandoraea pnomenusa]|uniref:hypothetical protein n=1 Tax=Pandoraea pnomenusa TaxID=93220 RepID=UPI003342339F